MLSSPPAAPIRSRHIESAAQLSEEGRSPASDFLNPSSSQSYPMAPASTSYENGGIKGKGTSYASSPVDEDDGMNGGEGRRRRRSSMNAHARMGSIDGQVLNGYSAHTIRQDMAADEKLERERAEDRRAEAGPGLVGRDRDAFILLVVLYLFQGIPLGLIFGTLPFILKPYLTYSELALFSLSTWPYSLKLLWSPIVDACFSNRLGRRKSWIVPTQLVLGIAMWGVGSSMERWIASDNIDVTFLTGVFVMFIFLAATQDIAVDGWALTLLSPANLSYASTAQTIGLHLGYTISFTVFLALNSAEFANNWLRSVPSEVPMITIGGYLRFWAVLFFLFTLWLAFWKKEDPVGEDDPDMDVKKVYKVMWSILTLKNIQAFIVFHLVAKLGFQVHEITSLKLIEKGLPKEDLAITNLLNFPFELVGGWLAARWSRGDRPLRAWETAYWARLGMAGIATLLVWGFPTQGKVGQSYFVAIVATSLLASFTSTIQFVGIMAFHTQIADPLIGGTYMTLLNTVSNMGGTWPRPLVLKGVDYFTVSSCQRMDEKTGQLVAQAAECTSEHGKTACAALGGSCVTETDGYYAMSAICIVAGALILVLFIKPTARRLQALPLSAWRVKIPQ